jgi:serine/threonine protein kinase
MSNALEYLRKLFSIKTNNHNNNNSQSSYILNRQRKNKKLLAQHQNKDKYFRLGNYIIYKNIKIGKGSFSVIKLGKKIDDGKLVAVKIIKNVRNPKKRDLIKREIQILRKVKHPNIIELYDVLMDENNDNVYLMLEYCDIGDLKTFQNKKKFHEYKALKIAHQIKSALKYLFENNIIHRDLKPHNILLDDNYNIKLTDFGFAKEINSSNTEILQQTFCGSPLYMSPEILNKSNYNNKSDIWSFGVIIYELITGTFPFTGKSFDELTNNINNNEFNISDEIKNNISTELSDLLYKIFNKNITSRINWIDIFQHTWFSDEFYKKIQDEYYSQKEQKKIKNTTYIDKFKNTHLGFNNTNNFKNINSNTVLTHYNNHYKQPNNNNNSINENDLYSIDQKPPENIKNIVQNQYSSSDENDKLYYSYVYIDDNGNEITVNENENYILYNNNKYIIRNDKKIKNIQKIHDYIDINFYDDSMILQSEIKNAMKPLYIDTEKSKIFIPLDDEENEKNDKNKDKTNNNNEKQNKDLQIKKIHDIKNNINNSKDSSLNNSKSVQVSNFVLYISDNEDE